MRCSRIVKQTLILLLLAGCVFAQPNTPGNYRDFRAFWAEFRAAILNMDEGKIVELSHFPFETRGPDDSDPIVYHDEKSFHKIIDEILDQPIYRMVGSQLNLTSMREVIKNKADISEGDLTDDGFARIELFSFIKLNHVWKFNRAYLEE
jgi:hypothetical protein